MVSAVGSAGSAAGDATTFGGDVERPDDGVERVIDALHDARVVALMPGGVGAGGQLALDGGAREHAGVGHQGVDGVDGGVEVVLEGVEVTVVGVGDPGRDGALGDAVDVVGGDVQRPDDGVVLFALTMRWKSPWCLVARHVVELAPRQR